MPATTPSAIKLVNFPPSGKVIFIQSANEAKELSIKSIGTVAQS